jgi:hypothetical protein
LSVPDGLATLVAREPDGQVGSEPQDHVLVVAEPAGDQEAVFSSPGVAVLVVGDALGDGAAVSGPDLGEVGVGELAPPSGAGGGCRRVGVDEQVGHGPGLDLPVRGRTGTGRRDP